MILTIDTIYIIIITILIGISGFTARYLFLKISKATELYAKEFIRVDKEDALLRKDLELMCQSIKLEIEHIKENHKHMGDKLYSHGEKLGSLISRVDKLEYLNE